MILLQRHYENFYDGNPVNKLPTGSVIIENFTSWYLNGCTYFEVETAGKSFTYVLDRKMKFDKKGCFTGYEDGEVLYTLDSHGNKKAPSVFRKPLIRHEYLIMFEDSGLTHNINMHTHFVFAYTTKEALDRCYSERPEFRFRKITKIQILTVDADHNNKPA